MQAGNTVVVSGLSPETTKDALLEFLSVCGKIISSTDICDGSCDVTFETPEGLQTAVLVTGAIVVDAPIVIAAKHQPVHHERESPADVDGSTSTIEQMIAEGRIKGEAFITEIRGRLTQLQNENELVASASEKFSKAKETMVEKISGPKVRGEPTTQHYYYGKQPQWGPPPSQ